MEIPVLVHGKGIYDSDDMKMKYTGMILEGSRIKEMGPFEELGPAYPGARVMDFSDCYILPGLVNTHVHLEFTPCRDTYGIYRREDRKTRLARAVEHAGTLLRSGVTTVRDAGSSMELIGLCGAGMQAQNRGQSCRGFRQRVCPLPRTEAIWPFWEKRQTVRRD